MTVNYITEPIPSAMGRGKGGWRGKIVGRSARSLEAIAEAVAKRTGWSAYQVKSVFTGVMEETIRDAQETGSVQRLGDYGTLRLNLRGRFKGVDDVYDPARHTLAFSFTPGKRLRTCKPAFTLENKVQPFGWSCRNTDTLYVVTGCTVKGSTAKVQKPQSPEDFKLSGEFEANKGRLPWPAVGPVADHFGQHAHPVYKSVKLPFNNGINITVAKGTEVKCVFNGEVKRVIVMPGYNKCALVQHGEYFTFYCKLSSVSVKAGDKIKAGQTVGIVDTIDGQTQLHFQLWKGTTPQNPELWLKSRY